MTTITINKGKKSDIDFVLDMAKRLGIDFSVTEVEDKPKSKTKKMSYAEKQKAIKELSAEINRNVNKRLYEYHNLPMPE